MKNFTLFSIFILFFHSAAGQVDIQKKAFSQAREMTEVYNNREISKFVDFLLPSYYGNDEANKPKVSEVWERILKKDTARMELVRIEKITRTGRQYQALFQYNFRGHESYIIGISEDKGDKWFFTQIFSKRMKFHQLLEQIPSLDIAMAEIIDPEYGKRISYQIGKEVAPFEHADINGNILSSDTLKDKAIVLNFWGITCPPCIKEIPELNRLVEKYSGENIKFIAPATYTPEQVLKEKFLPETPFLYDIVLVDGDDYAVSSYPTHIILNQKHEVVEIITGYSERNIQKLEKTIKEIL